jgi:hypothetical protein
LDLNDQRQFDEPEQELEGQVSNQHQSLVRYPSLSFAGHIIPGSYRDEDDSVVVEAAGSERVEARSKKEAKPSKAKAKARNIEQAEEETSDPRGFFYNIDYPVSVIIAPDDEKAASEHREKVIPPNKPSRLRVSEGVKEGLIPIDAVHDAQVNPKQRLTLRNPN